ncbi:MAG: hypothetical protein EBU29_03950 [Gammaproteobacteria bacterium]|nr:hypothetical protein [Gammaproteobacteria bacterium]
MRRRYKRGAIALLGGAALAGCALFPPPTPPSLKLLSSTLTADALVLSAELMPAGGTLDALSLTVGGDTLPCTAEASKQGGTQFLHCPLMGARLLGQAAEWRRSPPPSLMLTVRARWTQGQADPLTLERQQRVAFTLPTPEA